MTDQALIIGRRKLLSLAGLGAYVAAFGVLMPFKLSLAAEEIKKIMKTDDEWERELTPKQFDVLRHEGTERPFTSALLDEHRKGQFICAGCGLPLFTSDTKFDSGTGWPSFFRAIDGHVETKRDVQLIMVRTEYHCARCGGHQGHVFEDGPQPTGLRYCNNGVALRFVPDKEGGDHDR